MHIYINKNNKTYQSCSQKDLFALESFQCQISDYDYMHLILQRLRMFCGGNLHWCSMLHLYMCPLEYIQLNLVRQAMLELDHILKINQWWVKRENLVRQAIIELGHILKTRKNCFRYLKRLPLMRPSVQQPISKDKNVMARTRKYYLKNNYLTLRSKIKVPRRSLRYATHRLMVMHPHTK